MNLFKKKEKKQDGEKWIIKMALQEAMRELEEQKNIIKKLQSEINIFNEEKNAYQELINDKNNLHNNLEVLQNTIENIKELCKDKKVIGAKIILKELGE